jgi:hypothetical protein
VPPQIIEEHSTVTKFDRPGGLSGGHPEIKLPPVQSARSQTHGDIPMARTTIALAAALSLAATLSAVSAQAQSPRTFVSAAGSDSNPCTFAAPCRHFQAAVNATSPGGEVDALDPAGYSPITINKAITIEGQGWSYIAPPASGNAITITAGATDKVVIHGISLNGAGVSGGTNGIVFNSGGSLTVTNCVLQYFVYDGTNATTGNGILMRPTSGTVEFAIIGTTASNNGNFGIVYLPSGGAPSANGVIDHALALDNSYGIAFITVNATGGSTAVTVSNSVATNNSTTGVVANNPSGPTLLVSVDNVIASGNNVGVDAESAATVLLGRSVITGNSDTGVLNRTSPNTLYTYKDNRINLNGTDISGSLNTSFLTQ